MADVPQLRDKIKDFNAEQPEVAAEAAPSAGELIDPARESRRTQLVAQFDTAVDDLTELLEREAEAIERLETDALGIYVADKERAYTKLREVIERSLVERFPLNGPDEALTQARLQRFEAASRRNLNALEALRGAVGHVSALLVKATEEENSEGLYASCGRAVRAVEVSPAGVNLDL